MSYWTPWTWVWLALTGAAAVNLFFSWRRMQIAKAALRDLEIRYECCRYCHSLPFRCSVSERVPDPCCPKCSHFSAADAEGAR